MYIALLYYGFVFRLVDMKKKEKCNNQYQDYTAGLRYILPLFMEGTENDYKDIIISIYLIFMYRIRTTDTIYTRK